MHSERPMHPRVTGPTHIPIRSCRVRVGDDAATKDRLPKETLSFIPE